MRERRSFLLLMACTALIYSDQNLLAPNLSTVAKEFGFDHMQKKLSCTYLCAMEFIEGIDESLVETFQAKLEKEIETMEKDEEENEIMEREAEEEPYCLIELWIDSLQYIASVI